jgi:hypothetical protein
MNTESDKSVSADEREETGRAAAPVDEAVTESPVDEAVTESVASAPAAAPVVAARAETVRTVRTTKYTPSAVVAAVVAIAMLVLGGITVGRAGFDGSLGQPVVTVAGFTATALLGLIVFGFGAVLLIAAVARQRYVILALGIIGGVAGLIAVFEPTVGGDSLPIERELGIWTAIAMAAIVVSALLPTVSRVNTRQTTEVK